LLQKPIKNAATWFAGVKHGRQKPALDMSGALDAAGFSFLPLGIGLEHSL
jgi:hypothetical protein